MQTRRLEFHDTNDREADFRKGIFYCHASNHPARESALAIVVTFLLPSRYRGERPTVKISGSERINPTLCTIARSGGGGIRGVENTSQCHRSSSETSRDGTHTAKTKSLTRFVPHTARPCADCDLRSPLVPSSTRQRYQVAMPSNVFSASAYWTQQCAGRCSPSSPHKCITRHRHTSKLPWARFVFATPTYLSRSRWRRPCPCPHRTIPTPGSCEII